jgi:hypothetical protein
MCLAGNGLAILADQGGGFTAQSRSQVDFPKPGKTL